MTANIQNRTLYISDNLPILRGINSECIDLIYLDPPFNTGKQWKAPIGSPAEGAEFKDIWTDEDIEKEWIGIIAEENQDLWNLIQATEQIHSKPMRIYLTAMTVRLFECHRVLKDTGSIYLHCDPTASHYLKVVMDNIFGKNNFRNEIIWKRTHAHSNSKKYGSIHDTILYYSKSQKTIWNPIYTKHDQEYIKKFYHHQDEKGYYRTVTLTAPGTTKHGESGQPWRNIDPKNRSWSAPRRESCPNHVKLPDNYESLSVHKKLDVLDNNQLIYFPQSGKIPQFKRYLSTSKGRKLQDIITDINPLQAKSKERTGYPTQKPLALLERIIQSSSNEGDIILDPFCGCATACAAAEKLKREWIGIDISQSAEFITEYRLRTEVNPNQPEFWGRQKNDNNNSTTNPNR